MKYKNYCQMSMGLIFIFIIIKIITDRTKIILKYKEKSKCYLQRSTGPLDQLVLNQLCFNKTNKKNYSKRKTINKSEIVHKCNKNK